MPGSTGVHMQWRRTDCKGDRYTLFTTFRVPGYVSNYGPVTFGIQKLVVEPEAISQVKKYTVEPLYNGNQNIARCP